MNNKLLTGLLLQIPNVLILIAFIFVPYYIGYNIGDNKSTLCDMEAELGKQSIEVECNIFIIWGEGLIYLFCLIVILLLINEWIKWNWNLAKEFTKIK